MKDKCFFCNKKRTGRWALLFSPPVKDSKGSVVWKFHVCPKCYKQLMEVGT